MTEPTARPGRRRTLAAGRMIVLLACLAPAAYAALRLFGARPLDTVYWFVGSAVFHDLVLFPLYAAADAALVAVLRRRPALAAPRGVPWINHLRFPTAVSGLMLLVWTPLIFRLPVIYHGVTGFSTDPYLARWIWVTAAVFGVSAACYVVRLARHRGRGGTCPPGGDDEL